MGKRNILYTNQAKKAKTILLAGSMALTSVLSSPIVSVVHAEETATTTTESSKDKSSDQSKNTSSTTSEEKTTSVTDSKTEELKNVALETIPDSASTIETKSDADYTISMDNSESVQISNIISSVASKVNSTDSQEKTQDNSSTSSTDTSALKSAVATTSDKSSTNQVLNSIKEIKNAIVGQPDNLQDDSDVLSLNSSNGYSYVSGDTLFQVKNLDVTKTGEQSVKIETRALSSTEKQLLTLSAADQEATDKVISKLKGDKSSEKVTINMVDVTAPEITFSDASTTLSVGDTFDINAYVASVVDASDGDVGYSVDGSVDTGNIGTYSVNVSAKDSAGNTSTKTLTINVEEKADEKTDTSSNKTSNNTATSSATTNTTTNTTTATATDGSTASAIANAALAQIGVNQDCTMLVTNSLKAVGINFHGWPYQYSSLGSWTSNPVPGDIIIYSGHVAVYVGNGQAVHGGWLGYTTVKSSVSCTNALIGYIHVGG